MLFFRSEDTLNEWLASEQVQRGHVFTIPQLWDLSQRWYQNRMSPDFHGRTLGQVQEIFHEFELTSEFWQIP
ncbi:MAG TPA: hypothetical protein VFY26_17430 [Anaerolineales bacterium]|nr:hypothetical protein [Anaerolineales bacterium]